MKKYNILYIHDFKFLIFNGLVYTSVGLPQEYFERFKIKDVSNEVSIISRSIKTNIESDVLGYHLLENNHVRLKYIGVENYLLLMISVFNSWRAILTSNLIVINYPTINSIPIAVLIMIAGFRSKFSLEISGSNDLFNTKGLRGRFIAKVHKFLILKLEPKAAGILTVANYLVEGFKNKNILIASNVIIKKRILNNFENFDEKRILFAGGLVARKGIQTIIDAAIIMLKMDPSIKIYMAGGHEDRNWKVTCQVNNLKNINFLGILSKDELNEEMKKSYIYVQPSIQEGLPRATIEAMAFGLPVIATKIPAFLEILPSECLIDVGSGNQLAAKIIELVDNINLHRAISKINYEKSFCYMDEQLLEKRRSFYEKIITDDF